MSEAALDNETQLRWKHAQKCARNWRRAFHWLWREYEGFSVSLSVAAATDSQVLRSLQFWAARKDEIERPAFWKDDPGDDFPDDLRKQCRRLCDRWDRLASKAFQASTAQDYREIPEKFRRIELDRHEITRKLNSAIKLISKVKHRPMAPMPQFTQEMQVGGESQLLFQERLVGLLTQLMECRSCADFKYPDCVKQFVSFYLVIIKRIKPPLACPSEAMSIFGDEETIPKVQACLFQFIKALEAVQVLHGATPCLVRIDSAGEVFVNEQRATGASAKYFWALAIITKNGKTRRVSPFEFAERCTGDGSTASNYFNKAKRRLADYGVTFSGKRTDWSVEGVKFMVKISNDKLKEKLPTKKENLRRRNAAGIGLSPRLVSPISKVPR